MARKPGSRFGSFELVGLLGAGGMGEVYRARDARLARDVAIKVLREDVAADPDRRARLEREARLLARLTHPNIAAIHGIEDSSDGSVGLVLELVEGATLADRLRDGPLPLQEALAIADQIARALETAHEAGVIHRDLKPSNVALRPDGGVKVLDFGLAVALEPAAGNSLAPTMTAVDRTRPGSVLGTASYMSPEQARGDAADRRTDVWAFGCVLFEMLAGTRAFPGESTAEVHAAVLKSDPDWNCLGTEVPPAVHAVLRRCLEKDLARRFRDLGDVRLLLEELARVGTGQADTTTAARRTPPRRFAVAAAVLLPALMALGVLAFFRGDGGGRSPGDSFYSFYERGVVALNETDFAGAVRLFSRAIEADRDHARAFAGRAYIYTHAQINSRVRVQLLDRPDSDGTQFSNLAFRDAIEALDLDGRLGMAHLAVALFEMFRFRSADARESFEKAYAFDRENLDTLRDYAWFEQSEGNLERAWSLITSVEESRLDVMSLQYKAAFANALQRFDEARRAIEMALRWNPDLGLSHLLASIAAAADGDEEVALDHLRRAADLALQHNQELLPGIAAQYQERGQLDEASKIFELWRDWAESDSARVGDGDWALFHLRRGDLGLAHKHLDAAVTRIENGNADVGFIPLQNLLVRYRQNPDALDERFHALLDRLDVLGSVRGR
jgi:tetratricopeptide (TPR) repeat protein